MFKINKNQTVKLEKGFIELKKYSRQIPNLFKIILIVSVFLPVLKELKKMVLTHTKIKITFLAVFPINLFALIINSENQLFFIEVKMLPENLSKQFLKSMITVKR